MNVMRGNERKCTDFMEKYVKGNAAVAAVPARGP